ncbi:MAG: S49 family peptidase [Planctomycetota bacterium]
MPVPTPANRRRLLASLLAVLFACVGCFTTRPAKVCMQGDITAGGTIKTVIATDNNAPPVRARALPRQPKCVPKIALIDVDGLLINRNLSGSGSMGENPVALFREKLEAAADDPNLCAVVLRINSPGGGVTASDIMRRDLEQFRQTTGKPVVACLMDLGAGGAYYLATASDTIVAHPTTLTGGYGVILNLYDLFEAMEAQSVTAETIRSGRKVDIGSPTRPMERDERAILEQIARQYHERMRATILSARPGVRVQLTQDGAEELAPPGAVGQGGAGDDPYAGTVFDGRVLLATEAQSRGLIDQIGYLDDAILTARGLAGLPASKTVVFRRSNDRALTAYDITPNLPTPVVSVPLSIPGPDRSQLPVFLYLWQPEPLYERTGGL